MRLGIVFQEDYSGPGALDRQIEFVRAADELGYELICSTETWGLSALPWLTVMARETRNIRLGTAIINHFSRSPAAIAQEFAALDVISGGRAVLGLGSSASAVIEGFHGVPFDRPLLRLKEYVDIFKTLIRGDRLHYDGALFHLDRGFSLDYARPRTDIPVYIASITPRSIRQTAQVADGIIPIHWPKQRFSDLRRELDDAARAAGRDPSALTIAPHMSVWITDGANDEAQWHAAREHLSHYINRMGDFYWQMFERQGYEAEVAASRAAFAQRDREGAIAAISDRMVRDIDVIGPVESAREQLQERAELGVDIPLMKKLPTDPKLARPILEALIR